MCWVFLFVSFPASKLRNCEVGAVLGLAGDVRGCSTLAVVCEGELASLALPRTGPKPLLRGDPRVQKEHECLGKRRRTAPVRAALRRGRTSGAAARAGAAATGTAPRFECPGASSLFRAPSCSNAMAFPINQTGSLRFF